jgi:ABC-2 type transport system permease protein
MTNAWKITAKDLRLLLRDRRTLLVLIALPMLFISILGLSAGQLFSEKAKSKKVRLGVVNQDDSDLSGKLIGKVESMGALELTDLPERQQALEQLSDGKIEVLVVIGPRYHELVERLDLSDVVYLEKGRLSEKLRSLDIEVHAGAFLANAAEIVEELVFAFAVMTISPGVLQQSHPTWAARLQGELKELDRSKADAASSPTRGPAPSKARADIIYQFLVPSYTVMFVFFIVQFMARSLIGERDLGTLSRLLIAPLTRGQLMIGKTIPFLLISLVQTGLLFLAGKVLFQMSWGEYPLMLLPVMLCTSLAATAMGLMVATTVKTESQVTAYANFLVLTMAALSGCLMPRSWQPELMQQIGLATPHAWALVAYDQLLNREITNFSTVWECCGALLTFAGGFFTVAWLRFRTLE